MEAGRTGPPSHFANDGSERKLMLDYAPLEKMGIERRHPPADDAGGAARRDGGGRERLRGDHLDDDDWERESEGNPTRADAGGVRRRPSRRARRRRCPFDLSIPGGSLPVAGVTLVGVLQSHRRRGILRDLMRKQVDGARGWGEPVAAL